MSEAATVRSSESVVTSLSGEQPLLEVTDLVKHFSVAKKTPWSRRPRAVRAVDGVSFSLGERRTLSLVGESGCGKTTTGRLILDLERPTSGEIRFRGERLRDLVGSSWKRYRIAVQGVFQDPTSALNPRRRVRSIVSEPLVVNQKLDCARINQRVDELLDAVGLDHSTASCFPHELSGGMRQRVSLAQSLALQPSLIVLDEPCSALDVSITVQIMNLLLDVQEAFGLSYLMISHDLGTVRYLSDDVAVLYLGQIVEIGSSEAVFVRALHPYTLSLISASENFEDRKNRPRIVLGGDIGSPSNPPSGCRFHPRCWLRTQLGDPKRCETDTPELRIVDDHHQVACHFAEELRDETRSGTLVSAVNDPVPTV